MPIFAGLNRSVTRRSPPPAEAKNVFVLAILLEGCRWLTQHDNSDSWKKRQFKTLIAGVFGTCGFFKGIPTESFFESYDFGHLIFHQISKKVLTEESSQNLVSCLRCSKGVLLLARQILQMQQGYTSPIFKREDDLCCPRNSCVPFLGETWRLLSRLAWFTEACLLEARGKKDRQDIRNH